MRILIADSDEALLEVLQSFLWDRGHEVEIAGDGLECLTMLREFRPDVLVLDRNLLWGGSDGVMAQICEDPHLAGVSVILVGDEGMSNPVDARSVGRLQKPYRLSDLLTRIESIGSLASSSSSQKRFDVPSPRRIMSTRF